MKPGELIGRSIEALQERLRKGNGLIELQLEEGYITQAKCRFYGPIDQEEIENTEQHLGLQLPEDYRKFLTITNGCSLFDDPEYGGEAQIYTLQEAMRYTFGEGSEGYLKVAWIYQDEIMINLKAYNDGLPNYLYVKDHIEHYVDAIPLNVNFELWLDRFIVSQGSKFWNWSKYTAENVYKLRG